MTVDGRVNNVSPDLLRPLEATPQGRPVTAETAREAVHDSVSALLTELLDSGPDPLLK